MENILKIFIGPAVVSAIVSFIATPFVISLAWKLNLIDDPQKNKHPKVLHTKPTPRGGGLAIFIAVFLATIIFLPIDHHIVAILVSSTIILIMGLLDDRFNLNPYLRLIIQIISASIPILTGISITFITNPLGQGVINLPPIVGTTLSICWIVFLMNGLNFGAKGVAGQLSGIVVIASVTIALLSLRFSADIAEWPVIILASIVGGAYFGFLPWHIYPQKIMPSFSGSNLAGFLLGILSILSTAKVGTLLVVLAIPLVDTGYVIIRRISSGQSPFWGDRGHLHHRLLDSAHMTIPQVAMFYWIITGILGAISLNLNSNSKFYTIIGVTISIGILILWLTYRPKS